MRQRRKHPSIRLRLTLVYGVVLVATCAALLALNYALLNQSLYRNIRGPSPAEMASLAASIQPGVDPQTDEKLRDYQSQQAKIARLRADTLLGTAATSAIGLTVAAVLGLGVSWVVAGRMLRPLRTLTATTRRISQDRLHERVALTGPRDELKELADTFDDMVARLEASFNSQRRFVADASHELRTPLTIVRTGAEVLLAKWDSTIAQWKAMGRRILTATGQAERLLDGLLALARSDSGVITTSRTTWRSRRPSRSATRTPRPSAPAWTSPPTCAPLPSTATRSCSNAWCATWWTTRFGTTTRPAGST